MSQTLCHADCGGTEFYRDEPRVVRISMTFEGPYGITCPIETAEEVRDGERDTPIFCEACDQEVEADDLVEVCASCGCDPGTNVDGLCDDCAAQREEEHEAQKAIDADEAEDIAYGSGEDA